MSKDITLHKIKWKSIFQQFGIGFLEGMGAGATQAFHLIGWTLGFSLLWIPLMALFQGLVKARRQYFLVTKALLEMVSEREREKALRGSDLLSGTLLGAGSGAAFAAAIIPLTMLTFGLNILIGAGIGALAGFAMANINRLESINFLTIPSAFRKKRRDMITNARLWLYLGLAIGLVLAIPTGGTSLIWAPLVGATAGVIVGAVGSKISDEVDCQLRKKSPLPISSKKWKIKDVSTSSMAGLGAGIGAIIGAFLSPISFGASVPIFACLGAFIGGLMGRFVFPSVPTVILAVQQRRLNDSKVTCQSSSYLNSCGQFISPTNKSPASVDLTTPWGSAVTKILASPKPDIEKEKKEDKKMERRDYSPDGSRPRKHR